MIKLLKKIKNKLKIAYFKYKPILKRIKNQEMPLKIELGSGSTNNKEKDKIKLRNFIGIDINRKSDIRMYLGNRKLPIDSGIVDFIYTSHFLEHLTLKEQYFILKECYRILKKGGKIKILVPDLKYFAEKYINKDIKFYNKNRWPGNTIAEQFNYVIRSMGHKYMHDFESLSFILKKANFKIIKKGIFDPMMDKERKLSIIIEATK